MNYEGDDKRWRSAYWICPSGEILAVKDLLRMFEDYTLLLASHDQSMYVYLCIKKLHSKWLFDLYNHHFFIDRDCQETHYFSDYILCIDTKSRASRYPRHINGMNKVSRNKDQCSGATYHVSITVINRFLHSTVNGTRIN